MLLLSITVVTALLLTYKEKQTKQILVVGTFDSLSLSQKRYAHGAFLHESTYEDIFRSSIDALPKFLRAAPFANEVTQWLAITRFNWNLNNNFCN